MEQCPIVGKEYIKAVYCHPAYVTSMQSTSWEMSSWMKCKLESRLSGEILITSDMQMTPTLNRTWRPTKEPLDESKRGKWKISLKIQHSKSKIISSGPITSWQLDGATMETVTDFIFLGSKITGDGDCSTEIQRHLLLARKAMTSLDSILKSFANKGPSSQSYGFSSSHVWIWVGP